jgi:hypothetical protein
MFGPLNYYSILYTFYIFKGKYGRNFIINDLVPKHIRFLLFKESEKLQFPSEIKMARKDSNFPGHR